MLLLKENPDLAIVFMRTKRGAEKVAKRLHADGIECREIHGNLAQNQRERVMKNFRHGKFDVLVATDLASRGSTWRRSATSSTTTCRMTWKSTSTVTDGRHGWEPRAKRSPS